MKIVLLFAIVGPEDVFQQTPRAVMLAPPSEVTLPPLVAAVVVIALIAVVILITGAVAVGLVGVDGSDLLQLPNIKNVVRITKKSLILIKLILGSDNTSY